MKARDPHQYVGGTSEGAGIVTWPTGADKAASFGPSVINESRYLLGVVHGACFDLAIARVRQGKTDYEHELREVYLEGYPNYQYTLHLPAPDEVCPFCNSRAQLTEEHIWPKWVAREVCRLGGTILNEDPRQKKTIDITTPVCQPCNTQWLSTLENDTASVMRSMLQGHETILDFNSQRLLGLWAVKTAYLIERKITQLVPRGFMMELAALKQPSDRAYVYLGAYLGGDLVAYGSCRPIYLEGSVGPKAVVVTFSAFKVVFQVFFNLTAGGMSGHTPDFDNDSFLPRLWPVTQRPMTWPPPNLLNAQKIRALPGRFDVSGPEAKP